MHEMILGYMRTIRWIAQIFLNPVYTGFLVEVIYYVGSERSGYEDHLCSRTNLSCALNLYRCDPTLLPCGVGVNHTLWYHGLKWSSTTYIYYLWEDKFCFDSFLLHFHHLIYLKYHQEWILASQCHLLNFNFIAA